jgi:hypothetical protein
MPAPQPVGTFRTSRLAFVVDLSELNPEGPPRLVIACRWCRGLFECDHEEGYCPGCIERLAVALARPA